MNNYLIPANANRGKLIFGFFRPVDAIVFGTGIFITMILLFIFQGDLSSTGMAILVLLPTLITGFLVLPIPHKHNVMVLLGCIYKFFFVTIKKYYWKGWCSLDGSEEDKW